MVKHTFKVGDKVTTAPFHNVVGVIRSFEADGVVAVIAWARTTSKSKTPVNWLKKVA